MSNSQEPNAFGAFLEQFGPLQEQDIIVLDYIFESFYKGKSNEFISLLGEKEQEGNKSPVCFEIEAQLSANESEQHQKS